MPRYEFGRPARAALLDQLIAAGFPPTTPVEMDDTRCWVECAPEEYDRAATVVAAHDAAAMVAAETTEAQSDTQAQARLRAAVAQLNDAETLLSGTAALTLAQAKPILLLLVRALVALLRLLARRGIV